MTGSRAIISVAGRIRMSCAERIAAGAVAAMEEVAPPPTELPFPSKLLLSRRPPLLAALDSDDSKYFVDNGVPREPPPDLLPDGKAARNWSWLHVAAAHGSPAILQHF